MEEFGIVFAEITACGEGCGQSAYAAAEQDERQGGQPEEGPWNDVGDIGETGFRGHKEGQGENT